MVKLDIQDLSVQYVVVSILVTVPLLRELCPKDECHKHTLWSSTVTHISHGKWLVCR